MDLGAYSQIADLEVIAKENNIVVPRLRGYRLMKDEEPVSAERINQIMEYMDIEVCADLCRSFPFWKNSNSHEYSYRTDCLCDYYLIVSVDEDGHERYTGIRWDRIHGWKRKVLKFEIKKQRRAIQKQFDMWNKYAGKDNVLYIHSRIGGGNWNEYGGNELMKEPWFLGKVDDYFDNTYCDIYATIK